MTTVISVYLNYEGSAIHLIQWLVKIEEIIHSETCQAAGASCFASLESFGFEHASLLGEGPEYNWQNTYHTFVNFDERLSRRHD